MNAMDDIRIRADQGEITDDEAMIVIQMCRRFAVDADIGAPDLPTLIRFCDRNREGGIAQMLTDVRDTDLDGRYDDYVEAYDPDSDDMPPLNYRAWQRTYANDIMREAGVMIGGAPEDAPVPSCFCTDGSTLCADCPYRG